MQGGASLHLWFFILSGSGVTLILHLGLSKQSHQILEGKCVSDHVKDAAAAEIWGGATTQEEEDTEEEEEE